MNKILVTKKMNILKKKIQKLVHNSKLFKAPPNYHTIIMKNKNSCDTTFNNTHTNLKKINPIINKCYIKVKKIQHSPINRQTKRMPKHYIQPIQPNFSHIQTYQSKVPPINSNDFNYKYLNANKKNYPNNFCHSKSFYFFKGFEGFYNKNNTILDMPVQRNQKRYVFSPINNNAFEKTRRVLISDFNDDNNDYCNKRHKKSSTLKRYNSYDNVGGMAELFKKTPVNKNHKGGIKIIKREKTYELNLFSDDYAYNEIQNRKKRFPMNENIILGKNIN